MRCATTSPTCWRSAAGSPADDLISELVVAEVEGRKLTDEEIYSFLRLLLPAGVETTYRASGNLLYGLLTNPDQLQAVMADRSLIPAPSKRPSAGSRRSP